MPYALRLRPNALGLTPCVLQASEPLGFLRPQQATGSQKEHEKQNKKGYGIFESRANETSTQSLQNPQKKTAEYGARATSQAAQYGGAKTFETEHGSHVIAAQGDGNDNDAGSGSNGGAQSEA